MFGFKAFTDHHNEPLKEMVGGYTHFIHAIEGNFVHGVQSIIESEIIIQILYSDRPGDNRRKRRKNSVSQTS